MLIAVIGWAGCFLLLGVAVRDAPPLWFAAARALLAGVVIAGVWWVRPTGPGRARRRVPVRLVLALAVTNVALGLGAMASATGGVSSGTATVLANAQPLLVVVPAWMIFGERPWRWTVPLLAVGVAGLALAVSPGTSTTGAWWALLAAAGLSAASLVARSAGSVDLLAVGAAQFLLGGGLLAAAAAATEGPASVTWTWRLLAVWLVLAVAGTAVPFVLWLGEAQRAAVAPLAAWSLAVPVLGVGLGMAVAGERPTGWTLLGYAAVGVAATAVVLGEARA